jgi:hypothetical protein
MRWFVGRLAVCNLACAVLVLLARGVGTMAAPPALAQVFTTADGQPCPQMCLFGVMPDLTLFVDVPALLAQHPLSRDLALRPASNDNIHTLLGPDSQLVIGRDKATGLVNTVSLISRAFNSNGAFDLDSVSPLLGQLGDLLTVWGVPTWVELDPQTMTVPILYYDRLFLISQVLAYPQDGYRVAFAQRSPVLRLFLYNENIYNDIKVLGGGRLKAWHGAGHTRTYLNRQSVYFYP